jgi:UDP-2,4-diacetamido-2,4,6-trideoxy-beta-L-altropyranose hydrolase
VKIFFRVDASIKMGIGHAMRCLTLAVELKKNGSDIIFISRAHEGNLNNLISDKGMKVAELSAPASRSAPVGNAGSDDYAEWLGVTQEQDARESINALGKTIPDWLIVDHYGLDESWEKTIRPHVKKIMVIDDLANRHHDCEMLLDQNWFDDKESRYRAIVPAGCTLLLGPEYALLRPEFAEARKENKPSNDDMKRIFVFFGGADPFNLTGMTLRALSDLELAHMEVDAVIGENNPHQAELKKLVTQRPHTNLYIQVDNMASIMAKADLAIGGGGATTWERICLNLESCVVIIAKNQNEVNGHLARKGYIHLLGYVHEINPKFLKENIVYRILQINKKRGRVDYSTLCDGRGLGRVVNNLNGYYFQKHVNNLKEIHA